MVVARLINPAIRFVVLAVPNEAYVVEAKLKRLTPVKKLVSVRRVEEDVESVPVIVTGEEPTTTKAEHETDPEQDADVVAMDETRPPDPMYARPCERDESRSGAEIVEEAVEKKPLRRPRVVEVEL